MDLSKAHSLKVEIVGPSGYILASGFPLESRPDVVEHLRDDRALDSGWSLALDRERLSRSEEETRLTAERERLRNNLLRSISHDLRTPLAAVCGASETLLASRALIRTSLLYPVFIIII